MAASLNSPKLMSGAVVIGRLSGGLHMAGFEVAIHGRFWVATEAFAQKSKKYEMFRKRWRCFKTFRKDSKQLLKIQKRCKCFERVANVLNLELNAE
jgi:hypothetical protein